MHEQTERLYNKPLSILLNFRAYFCSLWVIYTGAFRFVASTCVRVNKLGPGISGNCELLSVLFILILFILNTNDHFVKISDI